MRRRTTPILKTERLLLRPRRPEDAESLHPSYADEECMKWWSTPPHRTVEQTRESFATDDPAWRCWSITARENDYAIGFVAVGEKRQGNVSEIGYMIAKPHWGTGIAREGVARVIDQIFDEGQRRVFADTDPDNLPSRRLLEKLGFKLEGILRGEWETHIGVRDTALYGLLRYEWAWPRRT
ncbi:GNAT family N-acetyltransferase [Sphingomonas sp. M1-B02]|uniref:GNAT family N-acetyltransferase n=1 Tax=Sphingomonas sp. M1-B02 TaxID=3114300 RepID=UPI00223EA9BF|nr:GNAT family protein [Sphingomonas sp. S6-11]UZK66001.1 GNAT family N-acetyltransferase [Sphingomonas sp. S6-11]